MKCTVLFLLILFYSTSLFAKSRTVFFENELKPEKFVGLVIIDNYDGRGNIYFNSVEYADTINKALADYYGANGTKMANPIKENLTGSSPFKKDTV